MLKRDGQPALNSIPTSENRTKRMPRTDDHTELDLLNQVRKELEVSLERNCSLERENAQLKHEVALLRAKISSLKAQSLERKSSLRKKLTTSIDISNTNTLQQKQADQISFREEECLSTKSDSPEKMAKSEKLQSVPKPPPPPKPTTSSAFKEQQNGKKAPPPPPPPPPPPTKSLAGSANVVRRVPGVMEFYRSLTKRDTKADSKNSFLGVQLAANTRNMIGEIENRSRYLMAIKSDVETHGGMIRFLAREVENTVYTDIADVETFVKWLDRELSYLVDERAVLKHFPQWPEQKADAMREACCSYRDLKNLESEVSSFKDNPKEPVAISLKRMQALQDRLERSVHNVERTRESLGKKYRDFRIPWEWMLETGMIKQLKLSSMRLIKEFLKRITRELQTKEFSQKEDLVVQGAKFAYRVHQFAGGFDAEAMRAFEELRKVDADYHEQEDTNTTT